MNTWPILKPEDSPVPDPQAVGIALMAAVRMIAAESLQLHDLMAEWSADPITAQRRARTRALEVRESAAAALELAEALCRASRSAGLFSFPYAHEGVSDGR